MVLSHTALTDHLESAAHRPDVGAQVDVHVLPVSESSSGYKDHSTRFPVNCLPTISWGWCNTERDGIDQTLNQHCGTLGIPRKEVSGRGEHSRQDEAAVIQDMRSEIYNLKLHCFKNHTVSLQQSPVRGPCLVAQEHLAALVTVLCLKESQNP